MEFFKLLRYNKSARGSHANCYSEIYSKIYNVNNFVIKCAIIIYLLHRASTDNILVVTPTPSVDEGINCNTCVHT